MMIYTYVLQSVVDGNFYTGLTKNLKQRFEKHQKGHVESTKDRRPLKLIYYEACLNQIDATKREKYFKHTMAECYQTETRILFNRVNLILQLGIEVDAEPFLKHKTFKEQQRRVGIGAFAVCADCVMAY